jgi:positive regulator of sigma E activity
VTGMFRSKRVLYSSRVVLESHISEKQFLGSAFIQYLLKIYILNICIFAEKIILIQNAY